MFEDEPKRELSLWGVGPNIVALVRNPIYSAWIVFLIPELAMFSRSWPVLLTPLVAYLAFKTLIRREEEYLEKRFGQRYLGYKSHVNELVPIPRFRKPPHS